MPKLGDKTDESKDGPHLSSRPEVTDFWVHSVSDENQKI